MIFKRWRKLKEDFFDHKTKKFNISKVPDIYDNIKYDMIHNKDLLLLLDPNAYEFFKEAELMANFVV